MRVLFFCFQLFIFAMSQEFYDSKYDYFDVDSLINNPRLLRRYILCFIDKGPCPPIGRIFKRILPEVVMTQCGRCTFRQKVFARKVVEAFNRYLPEEHEQLKGKLDPEKKYYEAFENSLSKLSS